MISKQDLIKMLSKEFTTTLKVIKAFPGDKLDFSPHQRSQTAKRLISTFVFELFLIKIYAFREEIGSAIFKTYNPDNLQTFISDFEKNCGQVISSLEGFPENKMNDIVEFAGTKFTKADFILMMLHDQIHHRGQMTVYIRMTGGIVPSVYGPSADDPTTNL